ncbi:MAG: octanoyltransferase [Acidobacteria bacterium]|nr:MAG: octanoyltransferase [Acidobacteriota bacterium]
MIFKHLLKYQDALLLQDEYVREVAEKRTQEKFILLEHPHVITLGRGFHAENLLFSREWLLQHGVSVEETGRGGDVTYHGPGQIVGYPILDISDHPDLHFYLRQLEELMIDCVADFGIEAARKPGLTGIWVGEEKIGAIGVRVSRWVTSHGFALNVNTDLKYFDYIIPCGIRQHGVTSMQKLLGRQVPLPEVHASLAKKFEQIFQRKLIASIASLEGAETR